MTLLVVSVLLALGASAWVIGPVLKRRLALLGDVVPGGVLDAQARKRVALASLRELEYDHLAGKLDDADFEALRAQLSREALDAVRTADGYGSEDVSRGDGRHVCGFRNPDGSRFCAGCGAALR